MCFSPQLAAAVAREGVSLVRRGQIPSVRREGDLQTCGPALVGQSLFLRRLLLDACEPARAGVHQLNAGRFQTQAIHKKVRVSGDAKRFRTELRPRSKCASEPVRRRVGVIVGATLRSVLQFAGVDVSRSCGRQMRHLVRFLEPVVAAVCRVEGDREVLASGLACHRVLREQRRHMDEAPSGTGSLRKSWLSRKGLKNVAMGVTASVLVAHHIAAQEGADAGSVARELEECCEHAERALRRWKVSDSSDAGLSINVIQAEARALGRARAACAAAADKARSHGLGRSDTLRLQLETMRSAAWPAGERCDEQTHDHLCARIAAGMPLGNSTMPSPMPISAAVPLSAISAESWLDHDDDAHDSDAEDAASSAASSQFSVSSLSSIASSCGSSDADAYECGYSEELFKFAFRIA